MTRRIIATALMMLFALSVLCGCAASHSEVGNITALYQSLPQSHMRVKLTAEFPERVCEYTVEYNYMKDGESSLRIIKPELVSDVSVTIKGGSTELEFDGARLETGELDASGLTPLSALPTLIGAWVGGNACETAPAKLGGADATLIVYKAEEPCMAEYRTWFDKSTQKPLYAEIFSDGRRVIQCQFERVENK